jgi:hypothetical protein
MAVCSRGLPAALASPRLAPPRAAQPSRSRRRRRCLAPARALLDAASLQLAAEPALDALGAVPWPQALLFAYLFAPPGPLFGLVDYYALRPLDDARTRAKLRAELFDEGSWTQLVRPLQSPRAHRSAPRPARAPLQGASAAARSLRRNRPARRARRVCWARVGLRSPGSSAHCFQV